MIFIPFCLNKRLNPAANVYPLCVVITSLGLVLGSLTRVSGFSLRNKIVPWYRQSRPNHKKTIVTLGLFCKNQAKIAHRRRVSVSSCILAWKQRPKGCHFVYRPPIFRLRSADSIYWTRWVIKASGKAFFMVLWFGCSAITGVNILPRKI